MAAPRNKTAPPKKTTSEAVSAIDLAEVARVAYALYEKRGCLDGFDLQDWAAAETIVRNRRRAAPRE